ncbi:MAG: GNAT family N-acetyltransferase [Methanomicrobiales archaeon]|jgi:predicted N-acetyltransferase YhbS|nr:GNAT family N-acetyltransferase [Methanomicrobiales archaeon]
MSKLDITIRSERPNDYHTLLNLTYKAFLTLDFPGRPRMDEHFLLHLLQHSSHVIPELCFVAEHNGKIIGHILYTKSKFKRGDGSEADTITFGPLSVLPKYHRKGVGTALIQHSTTKAQEMGFMAILIVGVPEYYQKLGFKPAQKYGLTLADGTFLDAFMVYELSPGYLQGGGMHSGWAPEFDKAGSDDTGYEEFHRTFMMEHFPKQLTLRTLYENDVALVKRWLYLPHVAKWYKHPDHWMNELRERHGEFSFLTHFIVEYEGIPIGFCQYYDCWFSQQHEVWNEKCNVSNKQGEIYSIDSLIGEPDYLRRGFGTEIVRFLLEKLCILGAKKVIVQTEEGNEAAVRSLLASGFLKVDDYYSLNL